MTTLRDHLLEAIKRPALRWLHRTRQGEALLTALYLGAERQAEAAAPWLPLPPASPAWLVRWLEQHRADERRHIALFAAHLRSLTLDARGVTTPDASGAGLDVVSRCKLRRLQRLVDRQAPRFAAGAVVPALTVVWRMEEMGVRVFARHVDVLHTHAPGATLLPLLRAVLADEQRHARACARGLERLVAPDETAAWTTVVRQVDRIERWGGVGGAMTLLLEGVWLWTKAQIASFIWPSPTGAAT